jgi:diguanylate cyclase (GGDEF)-like protein
VCDLDRFKEVNDRHGHRIGDEVLVEAAQRITDAVRSGDLVCRFGGDEFVVLCDGVAGAEELTAIRQRVVDAFAEPIDIGGLSVPVGISVGGALAEPGDAADPDAVILRADRAMYATKPSSSP